MSLSRRELLKAQAAAVAAAAAGMTAPLNAQPTHESAFGTGRRAEFFVFAIIAAFIWPIVAVGVVGGYGFLIWMTQMVLGPPGPPGG